MKSVALPSLLDFVRCWRSHFDSDDISIHYWEGETAKKEIAKLNLLNRAIFKRRPPYGKMREYRTSMSLMNIYRIAHRYEQYAGKILSINLKYRVIGQALSAAERKCREYSSDSVGSEVRILRNAVASLREIQEQLEELRTRRFSLHPVLAPFPAPTKEIDLNGWLQKAMAIELRNHLPQISLRTTSRLVVLLHICLEVVGVKRDRLYYRNAPARELTVEIVDQKLRRSGIR
jgi:hypothetical protein